MNVVVSITRFVDDAQPGWVECVLVDAAGRAWSFVEKVPIVTIAPLDAASVYPQRGELACELVSRRHDDRGRELVTIDTERPWCIAATGGETRFEVEASQTTA